MTVVVQQEKETHTNLYWDLKCSHYANIKQKHIHFLQVHLLLYIKKKKKKIWIAKTINDVF